MVVSSFDQFILLELVYPEGLVSTKVNMIPRKYDKKYIDQYLFVTPFSIFQSNRIEEKYLHMFYFSGFDLNTIKQLHKSKLEIKAPSNFAIKVCYSDIFDWIQEVFILQTKLDNEKKEFLELTQKIEELNQIQSPRKYKEMREVVGNLEKRFEEEKMELSVLSMRIDEDKKKINEEKLQIQDFYHKELVN